MLRTQVYAFVLASLLLSGLAIAQPLTAKLAATDTTSEDRFGWAVDIEGDTLVVGAPQDFQPGGAGKAYVFVQVGGAWIQQATLIPPDPQDDDTFGGSVALDKDLIVVGATADDTAAGTNAGAVYVYQRNDAGTPGNHADDTWPLQAVITAADALAFDLLGISVDVRGDRILAGAWGDSTFGNLAGSAYVFRRLGNTWSQEAELFASDASVSDRFGVDVVLGDTRLVVGANGDSAFRGAAYVFDLVGDAWTETAKLTPPAAAGVAQFGRRIALGIDTIVAGGAEENGARGAAYVFRANAGTWTLESRLAASDWNVNDRFGACVALEGDLLAIGSQQFASLGTGAAYLFQHSPGKWDELSKITPADGALRDVFGFSCAMDPFQLVVGSPLHDIPASPDGGAAYIYEVKSVAAQLDAIAGQVGALGSNSLLSKVDAARRSIARGQTGAAINQLGALINELEAMVRSGRLMAAQAGPIIENVQSLIARLR